MGLMDARWYKVGSQSTEEGLREPWASFLTSVRIRWANSQHSSINSTAQHSLAHNKRSISVSCQPSLSCKHSWAVLDGGKWSRGTFQLLPRAFLLASGADCPLFKQQLQVKTWLSICWDKQKTQESRKTREGNESLVQFYLKKENCSFGTLGRDLDELPSCHQSPLGQSNKGREGKKGRRDRGREGGRRE